MSRKLLAFLLSELRTVRIICTNRECGAVVEVPIEKIGTMMNPAYCRFCSKADYKVETPAGANPFAKFAEAIIDLKAMGRFDLEFVLNGKSEEIQADLK